MNPRSALLVALIAAGFSYQPGAQPAPSQTVKSPQTQATADTTVDYGRKLEVEDWPRETMHQFLAPRAAAQKEAAEKICPLEKGSTVDFVIATVPDPQNSHFPYLFDRFLESIVRASVDSGYSLDRFWMPWETDDDSAGGDWLKREQHADWQARKQDYPGILVFRNGPKKVLGVLLIGENPVGGINKQQFDNALELIAHFKGRPIGEVKVLGPAFSGSVHSLGIVMHDLTDDQDRQPRGIDGYTVISGSARGPDNPRIMGEYDAAARESGKPRIRYSAAIENDGVALLAFVSYLEKFGRADRVAILAESGSGYANQMVRANANQVPTLHRPLILRYPIEISRLRNAYEADSESSALSSNVTTPRQGLRVKLKDSHQAQDSIPGFSPDLSPVSQEATLLSTLAIISRQRIEYAGIVASDILDAIFLGRMLKRHCPDLRLFIFDSDLVYAGVSENRVFQGMMMVSTYPLFPVNQIWTGSWDNNRPFNVFSSATGEGVYNACLRLLGNPNLAEYAPPKWDSSSLAWRPALYLTVVGHDALWPLQTLPIDGLPVSVAPVESQTVRDNPITLQPPKGWIVGFYALMIAYILFAAGLWYLNRRPDNGTSVELGFFSIWQVAGGGSPQNQAPLTVAACALLVAYGFVVAAHINFLVWHEIVGGAAKLSGETPGAWLRAAWYGRFGLAAGLLLAATIWCWRPPRRLWIGIAPACLLPVIFCAWMAAHRNLSFPYVYRSVHVGSGVSPIVPVLLLSAAMFWYAHAHLKRVRLCRAAPAPLPSFQGDVFLGGFDSQKNEPAGGSVRALCDDMCMAFDHWWFGKWCWKAVAIFALSVLLWPITSSRIGSLEGLAFGRFYTVGLFLIYAALLFACARFLHAWLGLHAILRMVEQHPLRKAFKRLGRLKNLAPALIWQWGGGRRTEITLAHSIDCLRVLTEQRVTRPLDDWLNFDYEKQLEVLEAAGAQVIAADSSGQPVETRALTTVRETLARVSEHLVTSILSPARQKAPAGARQLAATAVASAAPAVTSWPPPVPPDNQAAEDFVALQFVALIRYVTLHLKNLLEFVAGGLILAIASLVSYPFEPHHMIMTAISTCFFVMSAVFLFAFVQMNRNTVISYLNSTKPGKLDGSLLHLASFGALPLVTVLSAQFPTIGGFLFSWVKPALESMK